MRRSVNKTCRHEEGCRLKDVTKSEGITEWLIEAIVLGKFASGMKISEPELSRELGVSRGPLREAMMRLESMGLVERVPHVGARVVTISAAQLAEIYAVREALEGMAIRQACANITQTEIESLRQLLKRHEQHIDHVDGATYFHQQGDFDFHYLIIQASRNSKLIGLLCDELYHLVRMYRTQSTRTASRPENALNEHLQILDALEERDAELAEMLMRRHIRRSGQLAAKHLEAEHIHRRQQ
ncbi:GntR family transcriptional regulator [Enterovibrio norvegicus]|uniref:GntR family transcriptional regulator n=1 Tax=Enterovibrio norvegicus TaxID=188144 RepID=UPI00037875B3|nr:GntR family transcriptional regulator [Enterovibrio norvegicus]MCC4800769.1 GntR family transcriptional regulator [Enterovibrio norvegicus]OEE49541.1 GntR family transcriptional regulator [Enterovibrio norvegicus]PMH66668.1 GntR family transcriptional regulator [Enterovibrio norvegicus]PMI31902.1 GntR family transcriptional regulator [Enterovibrio norvegicus]PMI32597.1 GntR family transcriptional regulator [Enterovibrio norvegicus]